MASEYTPAQVTEALTQLVACRGNVGEARKLVDFDLPASTLRDWRDKTHAQQYERLERTFGQEIEQELIARARANALAAAEGVELAIEKTTSALERGDLRDPAKAAYHLSQVADSSVKKLLLLTGRPTERTEDSTLSATVERLMERGVLKPPPELERPKADAEATAEEIPVDELEEEPQPV